MRGPTSFFPRIGSIIGERLKETCCKANKNSQDTMMLQWLDVCNELAKTFKRRLSWVVLGIHS